MLTVEAVAIVVDEEVHSLPKPARHHDVIQKLAAEGRTLSIAGEQGFLLSDGRFATRRQARVVAQRAKQILPGRMVGSVYTSEWVW